MGSDDAANVRDGRTRPWWLIADTPGRAVAFCIFSLVQAVIVVVNLRTRRNPWPMLLLASWAALLLAILLLSVATFVAFRRHPDWVNKVWPARALARRVMVALAVGVVIGALTTVVGLMIAVVTSSGHAIAVALVGLCIAVVCAATLGLREGGTARPPVPRP